MLPDMGSTVYVIQADKQSWPAVGDKVTRKARMGFISRNEPTEWLSIVLNVSGSNPADIPTEGLSLYQGETRVGKEGAWYLLRCTPAGGIRIVELSTQPPSH